MSSRKGQLTIGLLVDDLLSQYQVRLLSGVRRAAARHAVRVIGFAGGHLSGGTKTHFNGSYLFDLARAPVVDGLIVASSVLASEASTHAVAEFSRQVGVPLISVGRLEGFPCVDADQASGMRAAIEHLIDVHGRRVIGFIRGAPGNPHGLEREAVFRAVLQSHQLPVEEDLILPGDFLEASGARAVRILVEEHGVPLERVEALVAANDQMAVGAISELQARGIRVPSQIAIVGFDDEDTSRHADPPITTVAQPIERIGSRATELLLRRIAGEEIASLDIVDVELVVRRSCGCGEHLQPKSSTPASSATLDVSLGAQRQACVQKLEQQFGESTGETGIDAALDLVNGTTAGRGDAMERLEEAMRETWEQGFDPLRWHEVLSPLDAALCRYGDSPAVLWRRQQLKDTYLQVSEVAARIQAFDRSRTMQRANALRVLGSGATSVRSWKSLGAILRATLPGLGVRLCYVCLFDSDSGEGGRTYLAAQYMASQRRQEALLQRPKDLWSILPGSVPPGSRPPTEPPLSFLRRDLLPPRLLEESRAHSLVVYPLVFSHEPLGYVVFDEPQQASDAWVLEGIAGHLSSAIQTQKNAERLREATARAERANAAKGEFVAIMSHEIRTPLTAIIGHIDLCLRGQLDDEPRRRLDLARSASQSLLHIVNDLLDFSKLEATRLQIERLPFRLDEVLDRVVSACGIAASRKGLEFVLEVDPDLPARLQGDPFRLGQVLVNLVSNAVKFCPKGDVMLSVRVEEREVGELSVRFAVTDTGIGIGPEVRERLFEPFAQGDTSTTRRYGGTGLGLAICRRLVTLLDGDLSLESELGVGSTFFFSIPLSEHAPEIASRREGVGSRVLLVEDNVHQHAAMRSYLLAFGYEVTGCTDVTTTLKLLSAARPESPFHLALVDATLPDGSGADLAATLAHHFDIIHGPIVLMRPAHWDAMGSCSTAMGVASVVTKPLLPGTLLELARNTRNLRLSVPPSHGDRQRPRLLDRRILVVQDDELTQDLVREILASGGAQVEVVGDGAEAVRVTSERRFDAVLMDLGLPGMDGFSAARCIRTQPGCADVPIVALTASGSIGDRQRCYAAGMNDCVVMPVDPESLLNTVYGWVSNPKPSFLTGLLRHPSSQTFAAVRDYPTLDREGGLARAGGNESLYRRMLSRFEQVHEQTLQAVTQDLEDGDRTAAGRRVHTLVSAAGNIGAMRLCLVSQVLESALHRTGPLPASLLNDFDASFRLALTEIRSSLSVISGADDATVHEFAGLDAELGRLGRLLEGHDTAALDAVAAMRPLLQRSAARLEIQALEERLHRYDFESALLEFGKIKRILLSSADQSA